MSVFLITDWYMDIMVYIKIKNMYIYFTQNIVFKLSLILRKYVLYIQYLIQLTACLIINNYLLVYDSLPTHFSPCRPFSGRYKMVEEHHRITVSYVCMLTCAVGWIKYCTANLLHGIWIMLTGHFISAPTYLEDLNTVDAVIFNLLLLKCQHNNY
jgi:hypothetical protein